MKDWIAMGLGILLVLVLAGAVIFGTEENKLQKEFTDMFNQITTEMNETTSELSGD